MTRYLLKYNFFILDAVQQWHGKRGFFEVQASVKMGGRYKFVKFND